MPVTFSLPSNIFVCGSISDFSGLRILSLYLETQTPTFEMRQQSSESLVLLCEGSPQAT